MKKQERSIKTEIWRLIKGSCFSTFTSLTYSCLFKDFSTVKHMPVCVCVCAQWLQQKCKGGHYVSDNLSQHSLLRTCCINSVCVKLWMCVPTERHCTSLKWKSFTYSYYYTFLGIKSHFIYYWFILLWINLLLQFFFIFSWYMYMCFVDVLLGCFVVVVLIFFFNFCI